jgi:hypothetical protein
MPAIESEPYRFRTTCGILRTRSGENGPPRPGQRDPAGCEYRGLQLLTTAVERTSSLERLCAVALRYGKGTLATNVRGTVLMRTPNKRGHAVRNLVQAIRHLLTRSTCGILPGRRCAMRRRSVQWWMAISRFLSTRPRQLDGHRSRTVGMAPRLQQPRVRAWCLLMRSSSPKSSKQVDLFVLGIRPRGARSTLATLVCGAHCPRS